MATCSVDVLIPVYNGSDTVRQAVASIQQQTVRDIRILVVDDGSTDETPTILAEMAVDDPRVVVLSKPNGGIVDALNYGLSHCEAEFVARHDADDLAAPERFERQIAYLKANPDCAAVSGAVRHIDEHDHFLGTVARLRSPDLADPTWAPSMEPYLIHPFLMARRKNLQEIGGYRHATHAEDVDLYWRLQRTGRLHNMDDVLGDYRLHSQSVSSNSIKNGRIQALGAQLAGISALRQRKGEADLIFSSDAVKRYKACASLEELFLAATDGLTADETAYLEIALAAKLLELVSYRPYDLEISDCRFIRSAIEKHAQRLTPANRRYLVVLRSGNAARLAHQGRWNEAWALISPSLYLQTGARLAARSLLPRNLFQSLRRMAGREMMAK